MQFFRFLAAGLFGLGALSHTGAADNPKEKAPAHRVLARDKGHVAIVNAKGEVEWEVPCGSTRTTSPCCPTATSCSTTGRRPIVEMSPEKKVVWKYESKPKEGYKGASRSIRSSGWPTA